jgi:hypothetical protein
MRMELVIPDGAQVHITVGHPPLLAPTAPQLPQTLTEAVPLPRRRPLLKGTAVAALLLGAFLVGRHSGIPPTPIDPATAAMTGSNLGPVPVEHASPDHPLPQTAAAGPSQGQPAAQVPPALAEALRKPAIVIPPPGQAAPPVGAPDPFGLNE